MKTSKKLISLAGSIMLGVGVLAPVASPLITPTVVQAAQTRKIKLVKKAYIYNRKGHRTHKKALKKGKTYVLKGTKRIHGKKYYVLSKKRHIKAGTAKLVKKSSSSKSSSSANSASWDNSSVMMTAGSSSKTHKKPTINSSNNSTNSEGGWDNIIFGDNLTDRDTDTFEPKDLAKIQKALWNKVQNARTAAGLSAYKQSPELDQYVKNWSENDAAINEGTGTPLSRQTLVAGIPTLSQNMIGFNSYTSSDVHDLVNTSDHIEENFRNMAMGTDIASKQGKVAYASIAVTYNNLVQGEQNGEGYQYAFVAVYSDDPSF